MDEVNNKRRQEVALTQQNPSCVVQAANDMDQIEEEKKGEPSQHSSSSSSVFGSGSQPGVIQYTANMPKLSDLHSMDV